MRILHKNKRMADKKFVYYDHGTDVIAARIFPKPMPESWHRKYQEMHRKNPRERDRFEPMAEYTSEELLQKAIADGGKITAKAILQGTEPQPVDPYAGEVEADEVGTFEVPELPQAGEVEDTAKPFTVDDIEGMDRDTLKMWCKEYGIKIGRTSDANLKVKLTNIIRADEGTN